MPSSLTMASMRVFCTISALISLLVAGFFLLGDRFDALLDGPRAIEFLRERGAAGLGIGIALLAADLVLPIPATAVLAALGAVYGTWIGGLAGTTGGVLSGWIGYGACASLGPRAARFLLGDEGLDRARTWFGRVGPWIVIVSRWTVILPEATVCMAGLVRMPFRKFSGALVIGTLPWAFAYARLGAAVEDRPGWGILLSAVVPLVVWAVVVLIMRRRRADCAVSEKS